MYTRTHRSAVILTGLAIGCLATTPSPAATDRQVFVCHGAGPVTFSDRPCGLLAEPRVLRVQDPGPGRASTVVQVSSGDSTRPRTEPRVADAKPVAADNRCRQLRDERERLDDRMRAGYSAREAAQLWNRWREVDSKIYAARC